MMKAAVTTFAAIVLAVTIVAAGWAVVSVQAQGSGPAPLAPQGLMVTNGPNPGTATLSWTAAPGVSSYRIGWLSDDDYRTYPETWRERFAYSDVTATSAFTLTGLLPGKKFYFIVGQHHGGGVAWSSWEAFTLDTRATTTGTTGDYDTDNDSLIEVSNLAQLDAMRHDLNGVGSATHPDYTSAFPNAQTAMGCPSTGCTGYELTADLDFDTNGNGQHDAGDAYWNGNKGWEPIASKSPPATRFNTIFDGGDYTIANLYINRGEANSVGLFRAVERDAVIRNVKMANINVVGGTDTGGLVGWNRGVIKYSYTAGRVVASKGTAAGGMVGANLGVIYHSHAAANVSGVNHVGGLVGNQFGEVSSSYATGNVRGSGYSVGGLAGYTDGVNTQCYATGSASGPIYVGGLVGFSQNGKVESCYATGSVQGGSAAGGLIGRQFPYGGLRPETINSYSIGRVSGGSRLGGLIGWYDGGQVSDSYWNTQTSGQIGSAAGIGKTTQELQSPTSHTGIYSQWTHSRAYWDFGTSSQYPVLEYIGIDVAAQRR